MQARPSLADTSELGRSALYVQGWYLFTDTGLDTMERNVVQAEFRGSFSVRAVEEALRKHWSNSDLRRRGSEKGKAFSHLTEDQNEEVFAWIGDCNEEELEAEGITVDEIQFPCLATERERAMEAYNVMQGARRTLKEARSSTQSRAISAVGQRDGFGNSSSRLMRT
jgi:hypothetical protein